MDRIKKFSDSVVTIEEVTVYYPKTGDLLYLAENHPEIQKLRVHDVEIESSEIGKILSLPSLVDLELHGCDIDTVIPLQQMQSTQLRVFRTPRCRLNLNNAAQVIKKQERLLELDLEKTKASDHMVSQVSEGNFNLHYLNFSQNPGNVFDSVLYIKS